MPNKTGAGTQNPMRFSCAPVRSHTDNNRQQNNTTKQTPPPPTRSACQRDGGNPGADMGRMLPWDSREVPHFNHVTTRSISPSRRSRLVPAPGRHPVWRRGGPPGAGTSASPAPCGCAANGVSSSPSPLSVGAKAFFRLRHTGVISGSDGETGDGGAGGCFVSKTVANRVVVRSKSKMTAPAWPTPVRELLGASVALRRPRPIADPAPCHR